jgi:Fe-S oxidoreductase
MIDEQHIRVFALAGYCREDFSVCLGCKICASVCTVNDLGIDTNPQDLLIRLFLGQAVEKSDGLVRNCMSCYRCTSACPWRIRIPEVVRALRDDLAVASPFEKAFKGSLRIWGRVYEPYVFLMALPFLLKEGYMKHMTRWMEYMSIHLPHRVRRIGDAGSAGQGERG